MLSLFKKHTIERTFSDTIHGFYFDKANGAIIHNSTRDAENPFFKELQSRVNEALKPVIAILIQHQESLINEYVESGEMLSMMQADHPASVIFREIQSMGYTGGGTMLRSFMRAQKPVVEEGENVQFETEPGRLLWSSKRTFHNLALCCISQCQIIACLKKSPYDSSG